MRGRASLIALGFAALGPQAASACDYPGGPAGAVAVEAEGEGVVWAYLSNATDIYDHGVFSEPWEASALRVMTRLDGHHLADACEHAAWLGDAGEAVFEDRVPRIADVTGEGLNDVVVVETRLDDGASLAVYGLDGEDFVKLAATPYIGTPRRWLALAGIADFDGDGIDDVAYVETPHIGGTLRIWSFAAGKAREIAAAPGFSNHRIGENVMHGGLRDCGNGPELVLASADWSATRLVWLHRATVESAVLANDARPATLAAHLECP